MKDIVITARRRKTELYTFLVCFILANLANLYSIITYRTSYVELITSIGYVTVAAVILYAIWTFLRIVYYGLVSLFRKKQ